MFLIAGSLLFGGYEWLNRAAPAPETEGPVRIGDGEVRWLRKTFAHRGSQRGRAAAVLRGTCHPLPDGATGVVHPHLLQPRTASTGRGRCQGPAGHGLRGQWPA